MGSSVKWLSMSVNVHILCLLLLPFGEREEKHRDHQSRHEKACLLTTHLPYLIGAKQTWLGTIWRTISVFHRREVSQSCTFCCLRCREADQHSMTTVSSCFNREKKRKTCDCKTVTSQDRFLTPKQKSRLFVSAFKKTVCSALMMK